MLIDELRPIVHWLSAHPYVGLGFAMVISFLESLAIVGLIVPGSVFMTAIGTLVGSGVLPFWATLIWAAIGAIIGDVLSFWLGHYYHDRIRGIWPVSRYPILLDKGQQFFEKHGKKSIFLGRFAGPMRPVIPMLGGMMDMKVKPFLITDIISAFLWAPTYMLPGMLLGAASLALPPAVATRLILIVILCIFVLWLASWLIKRIYKWLCTLCSLMNRYFWHLMLKNQAGKRFANWLNPKAPDNHAQLNRALYCLLLVLFIIFIVWDVKHLGFLEHWDYSVYHLFQGFRFHLLDKIAVYITTLGDKKVIIPTFFIVFAGLIYKKYYRFALHWLALIVITAGLIYVLKITIAIPRPGDLTSQLNYSFPSGHSTLAVIFYGFMASFINDKLAKDKQWLVLLFAAMIITCVCLSRIYLGAHWLTDVIGGLLLGSIVLESIAISLHRIDMATPAMGPFTLSTFFIFILLATSYSLIYHHKIMKPFHRKWIIHNISMENWWHDHLTLPTVRRDRMGHPKQLMNVEWLASVKNIKQNLVNQHWQVAPKRTFTTTLHRIAAKHGTHQLPLLQVLYDNKPPLLVLTLKGNKTRRPIVLRLWRSHFTVNKQSLLIGTVYFQSLHHGMSFFHQHSYHKIKVLPAVQHLLPFIAAKQLQIISIHHQKVLLIH